MGKKKWGLNFMYALVLLVYISFSNYFLGKLIKESIMTLNAIKITLCSIIVFILLGVLIGLDRFLLERKKEGKWKVNLPKLIFLGIPLLYFSMGIFIYDCPIGFIKQPMVPFLESNIDFISVFRVILGYVIITSFVKVKD